MILKTNLHFHTSLDEKHLNHNIYQGIDYAKEQNFGVLAYTPHRKFLFEQEFSNYAESKGILLIPGIEIEIERKEIVVLNCDKEIENIKKFEDLLNYKKGNPNILILAPHPYVFNSKSLRSDFLKNIDLFDAVEMTVFSNIIFNFNKRAETIARKYGKPFIATSDTHFLKDINRGYTLINVREKTIEAVLDAVKKGDFQNKMNSMSPFTMIIYITKNILLYVIKNILNKLRPNII